MQIPQLSRAVSRLAETLPELSVSPESIVAEVIFAPGWMRRCVGVRLEGEKAILRIPDKLLELDWPARLEWLTHGLVHASLQLASGHPRTPTRHSKGFVEACSRIGLALEHRPPKDYRHVGATDTLFLRLVRLAAELSLQDAAPTAAPTKTYRCRCDRAVITTADLHVRCLDCYHVLEIQP